MNYFLHNIRININQIALGKAVGSERKVQTFESSHMQIRNTCDNFLYSNLVNSNLVKWNTRIKSYETAQGLLKILSLS